jgi:3-methylcrotonyl-CoA carboxylase alpha subunit
VRALQLRAGDDLREVVVEYLDAGHAYTLDGERVESSAGGMLDVVRVGPNIHVFMAGAQHAFELSDPYLPPAVQAEHTGGLTAPMPGRVLTVFVTSGQRVARGAPLLAMEAMKMEHTVTAPRDGRVERILCSVGEQVKEGAELLVLV